MILHATQLKAHMQLLKRIIEQSVDALKQDNMPSCLIFIHSLSILMWFNSLRLFSCLLRPFLCSLKPFSCLLRPGLKLGWVIRVKRVTFCEGQPGQTQIIKYPGLTRIRL